MRASEQGSQAKCVNCGGPHPAWVKSCRIREEASAKARRAFLSRPQAFDVPTAHRPRDSLKDVNGGEWQVVETKKKRRSSDNTSSVTSSAKRGRPRGIDLAGACQRGDMAGYLDPAPASQ